MISQEVRIQNAEGFHVRPAQLFVQKSIQFQSDIKVINEEGVEAESKSILGLMTLGLSKGSTLKIVANGPDEEIALQALVDLVQSKFGEE